MSFYRNMLVAIDTSNEAETVVSRAMALAENTDAKITIIHVVEPVLIETGYELTPAFDVDLENILIDRSTDFIQQLTEKMKLEPAKSIVTIGSAKQEIHRICEEENIDLLVMGTHGRHGISMLLGSTANAVLHGTTCDVLAVKV